MKVRKICLLVSIIYFVEIELKINKEIENDIR